MAKTKGHQNVELKAEQRQVIGRAVKRLRAGGILPAVLYGKGQESLALQVSEKDFERTLKQAGESTLVYLHVGDGIFPTIIKDVARDRMTNIPLHADFYKVRLDEKIKAMVPVVFVGESPAVKELGGIFVRNVNELEVEAFPQDLPHEISVDLSSLAAFGDQILLKNITVHGATVIGGPDEVIASVTEPMSEEELQASLAQPTTDVTAVEEIKKEVPIGEVVEGEEPPAVAPAPAPEKKEKK